jgi:hypothetical protein
MHIMVEEHFAPERTPVPHSERRYLCTLQLLPTNPEDLDRKLCAWSMGRILGTFLISYCEVYISYSMDESVARSNTQNDVWCWATLYHAFSSASMPDLVDRANLGPVGAPERAQIWPIKESIIAWPQTR